MVPSASHPPEFVDRLAALEPGQARQFVEGLVLLLALNDRVQGHWAGLWERTFPDTPVIPLDELRRH
jgi:hypothetical protein